jgi:ankyrin repeat protein
VAALVRDSALLQLLLAAGADPSASAEGGFTPLMAAAGMDAERYRAAGPRQRPSEDQVLDSVGFVLEHGAVVNAVNASGQTALHAAAAARSADVVELLLKHGARTDVKDRDGRTPVDIARRERATKVVELLK